MALIVQGVYKVMVLVLAKPRQRRIVFFILVWHKVEFYSESLDTLSSFRNHGITPWSGPWCGPAFSKTQWHVCFKRFCDTPAKRWQPHKWHDEHVNGFVKVMTVLLPFNQWEFSVAGETGNSLFTFSVSHLPPPRACTCFFSIEKIWTVNHLIHLEPLCSVVFHYYNLLIILLFKKAFGNPVFLGTSWGL